MDQGGVLFCGGSFVVPFIVRYYAVKQESFVHQQHYNNIHIITIKYMDQQWPFLDQINVFFFTFFDVTRSNITITYYGR